MKKTFIPALFVFAAPWAFGDYTVEFGPKISSMETKAKSSEIETVYSPFFDEEFSYGWHDNTKGEADSRSVSATAYFGRVDDSGVPLAEAGFLSKLSSVSVDLGTIESSSRTTDRYFFADTELEPDTYSDKEEGAVLDVDLKMVTPDSIILGGGLGVEAYESKLADDFGVEEVDMAVLSYRLHGGFYYSDNGSILYTYEKSEADFEYDAYFDTESDTKTHKLALRQLFQLPASQHLALSAGYERSKLEVDGWSSNFKSKYWQAGVDYYPMANLQLGITTSKDRWEDGETEKGLSYRVKYFFTSQVFAEMTLAEFKSGEKRAADNYRASSHGDLFEFAMGFRF